MTSAACAPLSVISSSVVGWCSISTCKYPHATYLTNQMERCCTNSLARLCEVKAQLAVKANADVAEHHDEVKLQIQACCSSQRELCLESPGINARGKAAHQILSS